MDWLIANGTGPNNTVSMVPEELFHPGALKFYKEKGMKVGEE